MTGAHFRRPAAAAVMLVMLLVLVSSGCGSRIDVEDHLASHREERTSVTRDEAPVTTTQGDTGASAPPPEVAGSEAPVDAASMPAAEAPTAPAGEAPEAEGEPAPGTSAESPKPPAGIISSIEPQCVERPGTVVVTIETTAFADIAYGASFSDHDSHGQWGLRQTDKDGRLRWDVAVGPSVPDGIATVVAAGHNPETGGGSGDGQFRVAQQGGCR